MDFNFWAITKTVMKERGVTQQNVADYLGVSIRTVQGWFNKDIHLEVDVAKKLAAFLDCSLDYLLGDEKGISLSAEDAEILKIYHSVPDMYKNVVKHSLATLAQQFNQL